MTTQTNLKRYYQNGIKIKKTTEDERLVFFDGV
jgi:hypothetical protein